MALRQLSSAKYGIIRNENIVKYEALISLSAFLESSGENGDLSWLSGGYIHRRLGVMRRNLGESWRNWQYESASAAILAG